MKRSVLLVLVLLFSSLYASTIKVAVFPIEDKSGKLSKKVLESGTTQLRLYLISSHRFVVIDKGEQEKRLNELIAREKKASYNISHDDKWRIPLGQALSADSLLRATVTEFGGVFSLGVELVDLAKEATVRAAAADFDGSDKGFYKAIKAVVADLAKARTEEEIAAENARIAARKKAEFKRITRFKKEYHDAGAVRRRWGWVTFLSGLAFQGAAVGLLISANHVGEKADTAYTLYQGADNVDDVVRYRHDAERYSSQKDASTVAGAVCIGLGTALMTTGIVLWSVRSSKEKAVKTRYRISVGANPFAGTVLLSVAY